MPVFFASHKKTARSVLRNLVIHYPEVKLFSVNTNHRLDIAFPHDGPQSELFKAMQTHLANGLKIKSDSTLLKDAGAHKYDYGSPSESSFHFDNPIDIFLAATKLRDL